MNSSNSAEDVVVDGDIRNAGAVTGFIDVKAVIKEKLLKEIELYNMILIKTFHINIKKVIMIVLLALTFQKRVICFEIQPCEKYEYLIFNEYVCIVFIALVMKKSWAEAVFAVELMVVIDNQLIEEIITLLTIRLVIKEVNHREVTDEEQMLHSLVSLLPPPVLCVCLMLQILIIIFKVFKE